MTEHTFEAQINSLWKYPITGGPGIELETAEIVAGGIYGDRRWIVAEHSAQNQAGTLGMTRIGSKQAPELLQIRYEDDNPFKVVLGENVVHLPNDGSRTEVANAFCDEFGDKTPVILAPLDVSKAFSEFLDREVVVVRKTLPWQLGYRGNTRPRQRANAAMHFISVESVHDIAEASGTLPDVRRYKPNVVTKGTQAHQELDLIEKFVTVHEEGRSPSPENNPLFRIDRGTPRCPVPSLDPETGENHGDIKLTTMPKAANTAGKMVRSAGVYGHLANGVHAFVHVGDVVSQKY